jgi:predicted ester cyclase
MPTANETLLSNFINEVIGGQNLGAMGKYLSPNFLHHDQAPGEQTGQQTGLAGQQVFFRNVVFRAFSGFSTVFEDVFSEDDLVAARWKQSSRNTGSWLGRAATGVTAEIAGISIVRIRNGLIVEEWEERDGMSLLRQLGVQLPQLAVTQAPVLSRAGSPGPAAPFLTNGPLGLAGTSSDVSQVKSLVGQVQTNGWSLGKIDKLSQAYSAQYVLHDPTSLVSANQGGVASLITTFKGGLPDMNVSTDLQVAAADKVASRWTLRGTHSGRLFGIAATGRRVALSGITISRVASNQIQEEWMLWDQLSLVQQVGPAVPVG